MANKRTYADIDLSFEPHPQSGDVMRVYDANSVKTAVKHLVLTAFYERPYHPEIGSAIAGMLFENWSPLLDEAVKDTIKLIIANHEPRAEVEEVIVQFDDSSNTYYVTVNFFLKALMQEVSVDFLLERAR